MVNGVPSDGLPLPDGVELEAGSDVYFNVGPPAGWIRASIQSAGATRLAVSYCFRGNRVVASITATQCNDPSVILFRPPAEEDKGKKKTRLREVGTVSGYAASEYTTAAPSGEAWRSPLQAGRSWHRVSGSPLERHRLSNFCKKALSHLETLYGSLDSAWHAGWRWEAAPRVGYVSGAVPRSPLGSGPHLTTANTF